MLNIMFPSTAFTLMFPLKQIRFSARHSDAAKRITSCTTCDNKSRQKTFKPTLDIKNQRWYNTHAHRILDIDNIFSLQKEGCGHIKNIL